MSRANLFKSVEVQFPRPDPAKALAPVAESVSGADGFDHCIFCSGPAATKTRRGVLRCRKHAKECIDPDCKARRGHRTFEKVTKGLTFQDSSKAELLCDHCRNEFFRRLAGFDDQAEEHTGIARNFFVYRYTDAGDPKYGMTHTPTRRRNERSGGKTASRVVDSVLELYDGEKSFKARARTMDWLSPTFGDRSKAYKLECMIKHFDRLARGTNRDHPNTDLAEKWGHRVLATSGFAPFESAAVELEAELVPDCGRRPDPKAVLHPDTQVRLRATIRPRGRADLGPAAFTAQIARVSAQWSRPHIVEAGRQRPLTADHNRSACVTAEYDWNADGAEAEPPPATVVFSGTELAMTDPPVHVEEDGAPGWIRDLKWLPLMLGVKIHSSIASNLDVESCMFTQALDPDEELAKATVEWADAETGDRIEDFGSSAIPLRVLDAFGAFPATRLIAYMHALQGRRGQCKSEPREDVRSTMAAATTWYERAKALGDPIAHALEARQYDKLKTYRPKYFAFFKNDAPTAVGVELPTTTRARENPELQSRRGKPCRIVIETGPSEDRRDSGPEARDGAGRRSLRVAR